MLLNGTRRNMEGTSSYMHDEKGWKEQLNEASLRVEPTVYQVSRELVE